MPPKAADSPENGASAIEDSVKENPRAAALEAKPKAAKTAADEEDEDDDDEEEDDEDFVSIYALPLLFIFDGKQCACKPMN
jgi:hypothetical protein